MVGLLFNGSRPEGLRVAFSDVWCGQLPLGLGATGWRRPCKYRVVGGLTALLGV